MAVTITNDDLQYILRQVLNAIRSESQGVDELETVSSLSGINSLPALQGQKVVKAPISLLGQPATTAAATANTAAQNANDKAGLATQAAGSANSAAALARQMAVQAEQAAQSANTAAQEANNSAQAAVRKITTKNKKGETIEVLTPGTGGNVDLVMTGDGSGSGFYNVTALHPLNSGFYTKATAVAALASAGIDDEEKPAMIITFEISPGKWLDYRFEGTGIASFLEPAAWNRYGGADAIKKITVTTGTNPQELTPNENGEINLYIPTTEVDAALSENGTNPVQGGAVLAAIKQLEGQFGVSLLLNTIGEGNDKAYTLTLLDANGEVLSTTEAFTGGGGGGSVIGTKVVLTRITDNPTVKLGDTVNLQFLYDQVNTDDNASTGNAAHVVISIVRGVNSNTIEQNIFSGSINTLDVTKYIGIGTNTVRIKVTVDNGEIQQVSSLSWTVTAVQLTLASSFNIASVINKGDTVQIPFAISGSGNKTLRCYVDGIDTEDRTISASSANSSFSVNTSDLFHGSHSVQLVAELELGNGGIIKSNSIYFDLAVREPNNTTPVFATRFDYLDGTIITPGERPYLLARQYDTANLVYAACKLNESPIMVNVFERTELVSSAAVSFIRTELSIRTMNAGIIQCKLQCEGVEYHYSMQITKSDLEISEPITNMQLKLSATGRSNNDINRDEWSYEGITTSFENFIFGGDGWVDNALRMIGNAKATIGLQPLSTPAQNATGAMTFMVRFQVTNVMNEAAEVIKCMDNNGTGFVITTQEAKFVSRGGSTVTTKFASGEIYNIGFVAYSKATETSTEDEKLNDSMLYLYINGILSGGVQRGESDSIYQQAAQYVTMGSPDCTLDVYSMRAYSTQLTDSQMLDAYMIDLGGAEELMNKYIENDILDDNGQVNLDNIRLPYLIVTGQQSNGVPTLIHAKAMNQKDPRYDVDEIMFIHPDDQTRNFRCVGGCIRLQGTSSMAYPTKNYRIYFKNAQKVAGDLYLGCDRQGMGGTLQSKAKYSLRPATASQKKAAPVDCFCLKADFAESSNSHNTGLTKLVHRVTEAAGDLTPAQRLVDNSYDYDVRTCIDGYPCLVFYRNTINDTPVLLGKFNFNNDKSTEAVFGFLDIPGYHLDSTGENPSAWITQKFGGKNPTECWEFLTNDRPMGEFMDDDFDATEPDGTYSWLKVFEARFPETHIEDYENGMKPTYLMPLVKWVKSTLNNPAKFKNELANFFDVDYLCDYFVFTEVFGCVDQRVKNMMLGFWYNPDVDKVLGYMVFYDCDTILGVRNDGRLKYNWDLDHNTTDPELSTPGNTVYAFMGHNSVLWNNLRTQFADRIAAAYVRLRAKMDNSFIFNIFDNEQSSQFNERIYNIDAIQKYVIPKSVGTEYYQSGQIILQKDSYMEAMQGSRKAHRHWWITNRLRLFDARYGTGGYKNTKLNFKGNSAAGATFRAWAARDFYFSVELESAGSFAKHSLVPAGQLWDYTYNQAANVGTIFNFFGGEFFSKLDLSDWGGFQDLNLPNMPFLEELILGKNGTTYSLPEIVIGDKMPKLRKIDIRNYTGISTLNLSNCIRLEEVIATGSGITSFSFAQGCPLTSLHLPAGFQTLILRSLPNITRQGIVFANRQNITGLWIDNCPNLDGFALFMELVVLSGNNLKYVRMAGLDMSGDGMDLLAYYNSGLGGFDAQGNTTSKCKLAGTYILTQYMDDVLYGQLNGYFDELNIIQPEYSMIEFDDTVADDANISNLDNGTGYKFGNNYSPSGHIAKILSMRHRVLGKQTELGKMTICRLNDANSNYYYDNFNAILNSQEGDVFVYEPKYYYKGINDYLNKKKYSCFSSKQQPPSVPQCDVYRYTDFMSAGNISSGRKLISGSGSVNNSSADVNYSVFRVKVEGRNKVRFPTTIGVGNICSAFATEQGGIISEVMVLSGHLFTDGMYLIADIPATAVWLYFTVHNAADFDCVVLSDSDRIEDLEPEWVEHEACLTGAFEAALVGSSLYSATNNGGTSGENFSQAQALQYAENRRMQIIDYEMHKDVANLFYAKYGRRNSQAQCGAGQNTSARIIGTTVPLGMVDTIGEINSGNNCMGYENFFGGKFEHMSNVRLPNTPASELHKWYITMPDGTTRKVKGAGVAGETYITAVVHQKHMDIIGVFATIGSENTYYCDSVTGSTAANRVVFRSYGFASAGGGVAYAFYSYDSSNASAYPSLGSRLAFRGQIVEAESVAAYKALVSIA